MVSCSCREEKGMQIPRCQHLGTVEPWNSSRAEPVQIVKHVTELSFELARTKSDGCSYVAGNTEA